MPGSGASALDLNDYMETQQASMAGADSPGIAGFTPAPGAQPQGVDDVQPGAAGSIQSLDSFVPAPGAVPQGPSYDTSPPEGSSAAGHTGLRAFGDELWASTLQSGQSILGGLSIAARKMTADPAVVQYIEEQKQNLQGHIDKTLAGLSPQDQQAFHASFFGDGSPDAPTPGQVGWGKYIGATIASFIPAPVMAIAGSSLVAAALPESLAAVGGAAAAGTAFGTMQAGDWYNGFVKTVDNATPKQLMDSPVFAEDVPNGMSYLDAKKDLVGKIAPWAAAKQFGIGAAAGVGLGGLVTRGAMGAG